MAETIINRVAQSGIITFNLEEFYPNETPLSFDIKDYLFRELLLKEKDFRQALKDLDWSQYANKNVAVFCSTDAIVPVWAYMLVGQYLSEVNAYYVAGTSEELMNVLYKNALTKVNVSEYENKRVIIKGCSNKPVPVSAYTEITRLLKPVVKSLMYGEPCSNVPIYKKPFKRRR